MDIKGTLLYNVTITAHLYPNGQITQRQKLTYLRIISIKLIIKIVYLINCIRKGLIEKSYLAMVIED